MGAEQGAPERAAAPETIDRCDAAASLRPGGAIYIIGAGVLDNDRTGPKSAVLMNVTFMNLYRAGASYTEAEHAEWLIAAGCGNVERTILPTGSSIIAAKMPS